MKRRLESIRPKDCAVWALRFMRVCEEECAVTSLASWWCIKANLHVPCRVAKDLDCLSRLNNNSTTVFDSHMPCRVPAVLRPCRFASGFSRPRHSKAGAQHGVCEFACHRSASTLVQPTNRIFMADLLTFCLISKRKSLWKRPDNYTSLFMRTWYMFRIQQFTLCVRRSLKPQLTNSQGHWKNDVWRVWCVRDWSCN